MSIYNCRLFSFSSYIKSYTFLDLIYIYIIKDRIMGGVYEKEIIFFNNNFNIIDK